MAGPLKVAESTIARLQAQVKRQRDEVNSLRVEVARLRSERDHARGAAGLIPGEYAEALVALYHVAHHGLPPKGEAVSINGGKMGSKAPVYDSRAMGWLKYEQRRLREKGIELTNRLAEHDGAPNRLPKKEES